MTRQNRRRLATVTGTLAVALGWPAETLACPVCFQIEDGAAADGIRAAVVVLMSVTVGVLGGAALFVGRFVRRVARQARAVDEM